MSTCAHNISHSLRLRLRRSNDYYDYYHHYLSSSLSHLSRQCCSPPAPTLPLYVRLCAASRTFQPCIQTIRTFVYLHKLSKILCSVSARDHSSMCVRVWVCVSQLADAAAAVAASACLSFKSKIIINVVVVVVAHIYYCLRQHWVCELFISSSQFCYIAFVIVCVKIGGIAAYVNFAPTKWVGHGTDNCSRRWEMATITRLPNTHTLRTTHDASHNIWSETSVIVRNFERARHTYFTSSVTMLMAIVSCAQWISVELIF